MLSRLSTLFPLVAAALLAAALSGCANEPADYVTDVVSTFEAPVAGGAQAGERAVAARADAAPEGPYLLDTGDKLRVFVYGQPNLSRAYSIDHEGRITVPLIGAVEARGHTASDVESIIRRRLAAEFVRDPQVTVDVLQNRPFFIYGEVKQAGQYPFVSGMTVETAVAIAGGLSDRASTRSYRLTRRKNGVVDQMEVPGDYLVQAGDTVFVHERFF